MLLQTEAKASEKNEEFSSQVSEETQPADPPPSQASQLDTNNSPSQYPQEKVGISPPQWSQPSPRNHYYHTPVAAAAAAAAPPPPVAVTAAAAATPVAAATVPNAAAAAVRFQTHYALQLLQSPCFIVIPPNQPFNLAQQARQQQQQPQPPPPLLLLTPPPATAAKPATPLQQSPQQQQEQQQQKTETFESHFVQHVCQNIHRSIYPTIRQCIHSAFADTMEINRRLTLENNRLKKERLNFHQILRDKNRLKYILESIHGDYIKFQSRVNIETDRTDDGDMENDTRHFSGISENSVSTSK